MGPLRRFPPPPPPRIPPPPVGARAPQPPWIPPPPRSTPVAPQRGGPSLPPCRGERTPAGREVRLPLHEVVGTPPRPPLQGSPMVAFHGGPPAPLNDDLLPATDVRGPAPGTPLHASPEDPGWIPQWMDSADGDPPVETYYHGSSSFDGSMDNEGYFTNLMNSGCAHDSQTEDTSVGLGTQQSETEDTVVGISLSVRSKQKRSKNFSQEEDILLVGAWLHVTLDPVKGTDQKHNAYWARITEYYHGNKKFDSNRTQASLINRWGTIQESVSRFCSCLAKIEYRNQSGTSIQDKIAGAAKLYKETSKPPNQTFQLLHCWKILKHEQKWLDRLAQLAQVQQLPRKKQKTNGNPSEAPDASNGPDNGETAGQNNDNQVDDRPLGRKGMKEKLRQQRSNDVVDQLDKMEAKKEERYNHFILVEKERLELDKFKFEKQMRLDETKFEHQKRLDEERVMTMDISGMSAPQQEFYKKWQEDIAASRRNS